MTNGAKFDYEEIVCKVEMDGKFKTKAEKLLRGNFGKRVKYTDEKTGKELLLFLREGYAFGAMKCWFLDGICEVCDYSEEMEKDGTIAEWLAIEI